MKIFKPGFSYKFSGWALLFGCKMEEGTDNILEVEIDVPMWWPPNCIWSFYWSVIEYSKTLWRA
jgi:hypothetical protein